MGGCSFPEIACTICNKPLDLRVDLSTDENGSAVHEDCFFKRITIHPSRRGSAYDD
jgi:hypothetical protein